MTEMQKPAAAPLATNQPGTIRLGRYLLALAGALTIVLTIAVAVILLGEQREAIAPTRANATVTDGWLPAVSAANEARTLEAARQAVDGWSSRLLAGSDAESVTDGWAARYLSDDD